MSFDEIPKNRLSEEDIKNRYITPALESRGWSKNMTSMEYRITDGQMTLEGTRKPPKRADYVLWRSGGANNPLAVVEAKSNALPPGAGLQQAMDYARTLDVPFAYSSNGDRFVEHDFLTGEERGVALNAFPSPEELLARSENGLSKEQRSIWAQPYFTNYGAEQVKKPRYYQQIAIDRTVDAIASGQKRVLLVMATGTGKTFTAFQIVWRLLKSGLKRKVLYLADRNVLVDQTLQNDFAPLENVAHKINFAKDDPTALKSYQVYFALYQQDGDEGKENFKNFFAPGFFDLIIVDECHRGSAKDNSRWREILEYFNEADQIGMTATPKETEDASNITYFGEPVYTYSLKEGIEDGYLAPFKVYNIALDIGEGWRPRSGQLDIDGKPIEDRIYNNKDYDVNIFIPERTRVVAQKITEYLKSTDRMARTIVFCPTTEGALYMRDELAKQNADMMQENPDYVVRITGDDPYGGSKLKEFISVNCPYPTIAVTSKMLTTGVDCKTTKLIVLDSPISSMTEFKQIVGRGTRLRPDVGKTSFVVMDFRGVTRLFQDEEWDGPVSVVDGFDPTKTRPDKGEREGEKNDSEKSREKFHVASDGCEVNVMGQTVSVYDPELGRPRVVSVVDFTRRSVLGEYPSLDEFIADWRNREKKEEIRNMFAERGVRLDELKTAQNLTDLDDFDFICHVAFDRPPLTRRERAAKVRKTDFFAKYQGKAREILEALLDKYAIASVYELESFDVLKLDPFDKEGAPAAIVRGIFGGKDKYLQAIRDLKDAIYRGEAA